MAGLKVPKVGLEPTRVLSHRILSPARLPFRHFGITESSGSLRGFGGVSSPEKAKRGIGRLGETHVQHRERWSYNNSEGVEFKG